MFDGWLKHQSFNAFAEDMPITHKASDEMTAGVLGESRLGTKWFSLLDR